VGPLKQNIAAKQASSRRWLRDEVAELRKKLAAARAELHRLTQRDADATLN
jgi:hypothetical protein